MSDNLPAQQGEGTALAPNQQATQLLRDIVAASRDPNVDAGKTTALANLAMQMQDREAERRFRMAKHQALLEMPRITKKGVIINHKTGQMQSRYSKFEDIHRVVTPILAAHNLIISFNVGHNGNNVTVQPILAYADGDLAYEERGSEMSLPLDTTGSKNGTQGAGSSASYGKRHSMKAMLNIIEEDEDDDGQQGADVDAYERADKHQRETIDQARQRAAEGTAAYEAFYKSLPTNDRAFLGFNQAWPSPKTWHQQNKELAAKVDGQ